MDDPAPGQSILNFPGTTFSNLGSIQMKFPEFAHLRKLAIIISYIEIMQPVWTVGESEIILTVLSVTLVSPR